MSEWMDLGLPAIAPSPCLPAAGVVLWRQGPAGYELLWAQRGSASPFAPGFFAFPGGKTNAEDDDFRFTALRELFEETGILATQSRVSDEVRQTLLASTLSGALLSSLLDAHGLRLATAQLHPLGCWKTPDSSRQRFSLELFLMKAPEEQALMQLSDELSALTFVAAQEALSKWRTGSALLHPPALHVIRSFAEGGSIDEVLLRLRALPRMTFDVAHDIEFQQGIRVFPLSTLTLPPATHTNCYVLGNGEMLVVDVGSNDTFEIERLLKHLSELATLGLRPTALLATHHHADHISGIEALHRTLGLPVWAHPETASRLPVKVGRLLHDEETIELSGNPPMRLKVLHTPGHARGHVCLLDEASRACIAGDMVAGVGTIVIDPPEGHMGTYLRQLQRLKDERVGVLYPAHGPALADGVGTLDRYLLHRAARETRVADAVKNLGPDGLLEDIVRQAYQDTPGVFYALAERNTVAILEKLREDGRLG
jgi:endoribonuclease LACTB2